MAITIICSTAKTPVKKRKAAILKHIETIFHEAQGRPGYRMMQKLLQAKGIFLS